MKTSVKIISVFAASIFLISTQCRDNDNLHNTIKIMNHSDRGFYFLDKNVYYDYIERDSLFIPGYNPTSDKLNTYCSAGKSNTLYTRSAFEGAFQGKVKAKYLHVILFDEDIIHTVPWDTIRKNIMTLKRYYLTLEDLQRLDWKITYPPTEAMKDVVQYPPYGE